MINKLQQKHRRLSYAVQNLQRLYATFQNQKTYMGNFLLDGRSSLSNNATENAIRPFVTGRKNWLFADMPKGADASSAVYSLVQTAKARLIIHNSPPDGLLETRLF
ncbi:MAG: transposase [Clostridiales bacterium]|nr:transposase [Clostridiales bacterium]